MLFPMLITLASAADCPPPVVDGSALVRNFPTQLGQEVRLRATIERSIDITTALVKADGEYFAVLLSPEHLWTGTELKTVAVLGSTTVPLSGPTVVPHLMLVTDSSCTTDDPAPDRAPHPDGTAPSPPSSASPPAG